MKTDTDTLIKALRVLVRDIQSDDGVANAAIAEAADRLEEQKERISRMERVVDAVGDDGYAPVLNDVDGVNWYDARDNAKKAKP